MSQPTLFPVEMPPPRVERFSRQLLKWIGNKQRFADEIISYFPESFGTYFEPFLGSGAVLGTLAPERAVASDAFAPLMEIWVTLHSDPDLLVTWYTERWERAMSGDKVAVYEDVKASYNQGPNGADFIFLSRACYGGVVRFRQRDGYMSTPCGPHRPMPSEKFATRVKEWSTRTSGANFFCADFEGMIDKALPGDLVYCDPPYTDTQRILYGAQAFSLKRLFAAIQRCKELGVYVVLSIDGTKKSGNRLCDIPIPDGLFEREVFVNVGRSMLRRFQMQGQSLEAEVVTDRLLLTY